MNYNEIYPSIDLHGEYTFSSEILIKEFINDQIILKNNKICIIHGVGKGILKKKTHDILKKDKRIKKYYVDFMNPGCTIVEVKEEYL